MEIKRWTCDDNKEGQLLEHIFEGVAWLCLTSWPEIAIAHGGQYILSKRKLQRNGYKLAAARIAGIDIIRRILVCTHISTEHDDFTGWAALDARIKALLSHRALPVDECEPEGSRD